MTYSGIFDETTCKQELKRAKKYIKKQADIILALENEIDKLKKIIDLFETQADMKDYEIQTLRNKNNGS